MIYPIVLITANRQATTTAFKTQVAGICSASLVRFSVTEYSIGAAQAPNTTDCAIEWSLGRITTGGTVSATYGGFMDGLETGTEAASRTTRNQAYTAEPTYTANVDVDSGAMNQRGFFRWVAVDKEAEPQAPAVQNNGLGLRALSSNYTGTLAAKMNIRE